MLKLKPMRNRRLFRIKAPLHVDPLNLIEVPLESKTYPMPVDYTCIIRHTFHTI